jgi:hypothetical protein
MNVSVHIPSLPLPVLLLFLVIELSIYWYNVYYIQNCVPPVSLPFVSLYLVMYVCMRKYVYHSYICFSYIQIYTATSVHTHMHHVSSTNIYLSIQNAWRCECVKLLEIYEIAMPAWTDDA